MNLMESRTIHLAHCLEGLKKTGVPFIEYDGQQLLPAITSDDIGIYYWIPKLTLWLQCSLATATTLFFYGLIIASLVSAALSFFIIYKRWLERLLVTLYLAGATAFAFTLTDVYIAYFAATFLVIPPALALRTKKDSSLQYLYYGLAGIILATLHYIRAYSGLAPLVFLLIYIAGDKKPIIAKVFKYGCLALGFIMPVLFFRTLYQHSLDYSKNVLHIHPETSINHIFWHTVYVGFGFLNFMNEDNIRYDDKCAGDKVLSLAPDLPLVHDERYEALLKNEVLHLIKHQKAFVLFTVFAKIGVLLYYLLRYANVGLLMLFLRRFIWPVDLAFAAAMTTSCIFPLIAIPLPFYTAGLSSLAILFAIWSINSFIQDNKK